jgi:hypothetical protein
VKEGSDMNLVFPNLANLDRSNTNFMVG